MQILAIILAIVAAFFMGKWMFILMFEDSADFWDCFRFSITPDLFSLFRGELLEDMAKSFKFSLFLIVVIGSGFLTYFGVVGLAAHKKNAGPVPMESSSPADLPAEAPEY